VVEQGVTGFLCHSIAGMVRAVSEVEGLSPRACRDRVARLFGVDRMLRGYEEIFERVTVAVGVGRGDRRSPVSA
jgi:hypothetical protein